MTLPLNQASSKSEFVYSDVVTISFTVLLSTVASAAFVGNIFAVLSFIKNPSLKTSTNDFVVNMAMSYLFCTRLNWPPAGYSQPTVNMGCWEVKIKECSAFSEETREPGRLFRVSIIFPYVSQNYKTIFQ